MAEKGDEIPGSLQNLVCPLCLDVFEDATLLTCGHTFCRKCLQRYDTSHQDLDHMVCPLCRKTTKFSSDKRVDGLTANVTVNGLVDEYVGERGGMNAVLELQLMCTSCKWKEEAISFCQECNNYMCNTCHHGHQRLIAQFGDHRVIYVADIKSGKESVQQQTDRCKTHKSESKDMFCEECKVHICFKCVIVGHRDHKIKNHADFEKDMRRKVDDLLQRCNAKKADLEKNIQDNESMRQEVRDSIQKLKEEVHEAYNKKAKLLKKNEQVLIEKISSLQKDFDDKFDEFKTHDRQQIKSIVNSVTLVANDRLGRLEMDSLSAHSLVCEELETILHLKIDVSSAKCVEKTAKRHKFRPAGEDLLALGICTATVPIRVTKEVNLKGNMSGMDAMTPESVIIGYSDGTADFDEIFDSGKLVCFRKNYENYPDFAVQQDNVLVSTKSQLYRCNRYQRPGFFLVKKKHGCFHISANHREEIVHVADAAGMINIYDQTCRNVKCTINLKEVPSQALETKSGAIVTSTCDVTPSVISVYDRNGKQGSHQITASKWERLYATVDSNDKVYVARVTPASNKVVIQSFNVEGLLLKEDVVYKELQLSIGSDWCYLVSLSPTMLAFASGKKLYFLELAPEG